MSAPGLYETLPELHRTLPVSVPERSASADQDMDGLSRGVLGILAICNEEYERRIKEQGFNHHWTHSVRREGGVISDGNKIASLKLFAV
jgi:hypothetical protein